MGQTFVVDDDPMLSQSGYSAFQVDRVPEDDDGDDQIRAACTVASPMGSIFRQLLAECQADPKFADSYRKLFLEPRRAAVREIWHRGIARGEIDARWDCELVLDMIYAPLAYRVFAGHAPFSHKDANQLLKAAFEGLRPKGKGDRYAV